MRPTGYALHLFYETYRLCSEVILGGINVDKLSTVQ